MRRLGRQKIAPAHRYARAEAGRAGFTLMEVLVVLVIIAILIASLFTGLQAARQMAWRTRARDTTRQLVQAWNLHLNDTRAFPAQQRFTGEKPEGGYAAKPANLALLNDGRIYLELSEIERSADDRKNGLRDRWGNLLGFNLDFDYDGKVENPAPEAVGKTPDDKDQGLVLATAIAWSQGQSPEVRRKWVVQW